jgi:hypothetical protein
MILTVLSPECNLSWQDGLFTAHALFEQFSFVEKMGYVADVSSQDHTAYTCMVYHDHNIWLTELIMKFLLHTNLQLLIALSSVQRVYRLTLIHKVIIHFYITYQGYSDRITYPILHRFTSVCRKIPCLYKTEDKDPQPVW